MAALQALENAAGRVRPYPNAPRTLDLDIVAMGETVREAPDPILPHPRAHLRRSSCSLWLKWRPVGCIPCSGKALRICWLRFRMRRWNRSDLVFRACGVYLEGSADLMDLEASPWPASLLKTAFCKFPTGLSWSCWPRSAPATSAGVRN
ncbi:2-amino-4-hydroxy-6-hydroxymethyldihydropteridine diphosphokinase [Pseudoroseomonas wenyumeiae]